MKIKNRRDLQRRRSYAQHEIERRLLQACIHDERLPQHLRQQAGERLRSLPRDASPGRFRNRCVLTGRGRGVLKDFRLSRLQFRTLAAQGLLPGVIPAQW